MQDSSIEANIGFIGAGQMARALAKGFVDSGLVSGQQIVAADPSASARDAFGQAIPAARMLDESAQVVDAADVIVLAVKPQVMTVVFNQLSHVSKSDKLFVSIAAGVTLDRLANGLGTSRVIRVMPNTPCLVARGASGYCLGCEASEKDGQIVGRLLASVGIALRLEETHLDAVTGLSGSGPAFVYQMIEALGDGGVLAGLPRDVALQLAAHTVRGAADMVIQTQEHPAVLKDRVTSPGGTTIRGLAALEQNGARSAFVEAVAAATERSRELGATATGQLSNDRGNDGSPAEGDSDQ